MIIKRTFSLLIILLVSSWIHGQSPKTSEQVKVEQVVTMFFDGLAKLDMHMVKQSCTEDFLLLEDGEQWNLDTLASKLEPLKKLNFSRVNHLDFIQTEVKDDMAWVAYNNAADIKFKGGDVKVAWLESAVLVKIGKEWKIRMLHSTRLEKDSD